MLKHNVCASCSRWQSLVGMLHSGEPVVVPSCFVAVHKPKLVLDPASSLMPSSHSFVGVLQSSASSRYSVLFLLGKERPPCGRHRRSLSLIWLCISRPSRRNPLCQQSLMALVDSVQYPRPLRLLLLFQPFTVLFSSQPHKSSTYLVMAQRLISGVHRRRILPTHTLRPQLSRPSRIQ